MIPAPATNSVAAHGTTLANTPIINIATKARRDAVGVPSGISVDIIAGVAGA
jgi:hypothetical protein